MGVIQLRRIEQKLIENYDSVIGMSDYSTKSPEEKKSALLSRAVAACAVAYFTGATLQESAASITDGYNDLGIDAIFIEPESETIYFVQSKWIKDGNGSISQGDLLKFFSGFRNITNMRFDGANKHITSRYSEIEAALMNSDYKLHLLLVHSGTQPLSDINIRALEQLLNEYNDTSEVLQYSVVDQKVLYEIISGGAEVLPINIDDIDLREWGKVDAPYIAYYGRMNAYDIFAWWQEYDSRLFAKNIRFFKGSSDTNDGIVRTLRENPKDFWYFNNGIKVLCDSFVKKPIYGNDRAVGLFTARGASIVNGAQTVGCIGQVGKIDPEKLREAFVLVQFMSLADTPEGYDIQVTKLSNTQNRIDGRDFAALDPTQDRIRRDLWMDGITYLYKGQIKATSENEISIDEATTGLACYNSDIKNATLAKRNFGAFYESTDKPPYTLIFNEGTPATLILNLVKELRIIDAELIKKSLGATAKVKQMLVHGNRFITHVIFQRQSLRNNLSAAKEVSVLENDIHQVMDVVIDLLLGAINDIYPENYLNSLFKNNQKCQILFDRVSSKM